MREAAAAGARLRAVLTGLKRAAVAVSGGVDSMTLAYHCHRAMRDAVMYHAVSPAVPPEATERVRRHASRHGWTLEVIDAGEFADRRYLANPVNRCFFCKANLYRAIAGATDAQILSGANLDDLGDYRPGLAAAADYRVRHPLIEAGIDKAMVRRLAAAAGLSDLRQLPAAPCLSSRLVTGIPVTAERLRPVLEVERRLKARLGADRTVRCRVRENGVEVQLDDAALDRLDAGARRALERRIAGLCDRHGVPPAVNFAGYVRGSAFVGKPMDAD